VAFVKKCAVPMYNSIACRPAPVPTFTHPRLGGKEHIVLYADLSPHSHVYAQTEHPLYRLFCEFHSNMELDHD
jgi:hypothetical protein